MFGLSAILGFLNPVAKIAGQLEKAYAAHANAQTDQERIATGARVATYESAMATARVAMAHRWFWIGWLAFVLPLGFLYAKEMVWDTALGWGSTPAIHGTLLEWSNLIINSLFTSGAAVGIGSGLSQALTAIFHGRR